MNEYDPFYNQTYDPTNVLSNNSNDNYNNNFSSISIGNGNKTFKSDQRGIWLGHSNFSNAPFTIDMSGNVKAYSLENIGGVVRYEKESFNDTYTQGYYIGKEGIYMGNSGDTRHFKYDQNSGEVDIKGNINAYGGTIGGLIINNNSITSSNDEYPVFTLDGNGITVNADPGNLGARGFQIIDSFGYTRFIITNQTNQGVIMGTNGDILLQLSLGSHGGGNSFKPAYPGYYLGGLGYEWSGIYLTSSSGTVQTGSVGGGSGTTGETDGHSHSIPAHSHTLMFNYIEVMINGQNVKLLTA